MKNKCIMQSEKHEGGHTQIEDIINIRLTEDCPRSIGNG